jgi:hypothetical protein
MDRLTQLQDTLDDVRSHYNTLTANANKNPTALDADVREPQLHPAKASLR